MTDEEFEKRVVYPWVDAIDARFSPECPMVQRPFAVAMELLERKILEVRVGAVPDSIDIGGSDSVLDKRWFRTLYKMIRRWYRSTYGDAMDVKHASLLGVVQFRGTCVLVNVPTTVHRPAEERGHVWVSMPDHVRSDEQVLSWLVPPPNVDALDPRRRALFEAEVYRLASDLRFVRSRLSDSYRRTPAIEGFIAGVPKHLQRFAELVVTGERVSTLKSWWELQMAIESVLKGLLRQKTRTHRKIHYVADLLRDAKAVGLQFDARRFARWPSPAVMSDLRYGKGRRTTISGALAAYRLTIDLCREAAMVYRRRVHTGEASFCVRTFPWSREPRQASVG
jgi:hypothetical protein